MQRQLQWLIDVYREVSQDQGPPYVPQYIIVLKLLKGCYLGDFIGEIYKGS